MRCPDTAPRAFDRPAAPGGTETADTGVGNPCCAWSAFSVHLGVWVSVECPREGQGLPSSQGRVLQKPSFPWQPVFIFQMPERGWKTHAVFLWASRLQCWASRCAFVSVPFPVPCLAVSHRFSVNFFLAQLQSTGAPLPTLRWTCRSGRPSRSLPAAPLSPWMATWILLEATASAWASCPTCTGQRPSRERGSPCVPAV